MKSIIQLLRPQQWLKNIFVILPVFFDRHLFDICYLWNGIQMIVAFSLAASSIYCFNDIWDAEADRLHPEKKNRPIASGALSKKTGYALMIICMFLSVFITYLMGAYKAMAVIVFYIIMNIAYCTRLKRIAIIDVFVIALGFILRIKAGAFATGIYLTHWIVLMTFLLALFLAIAKRRDDVVMYEEYGIKMRRNVNRYSLTFMNESLSIIASITIMCYIMYTVSSEIVARFNSSNVYLTSIFVLAGIIRYLQLTIVDVKSGSPTKVLLKDHFIHLCIISWITAFALIIYM